MYQFHTAEALRSLLLWVAMSLISVNSIYMAFAFRKVFMESYGRRMEVQRDAEVGAIR